MPATIRVAQIKVIPERGQLAANAATLAAILDELAGLHPDVVVTPECFLDGYVATEKGVSAQDLTGLAIDPSASPLVAGIASWARGCGSWVILGYSRLAPEGVYNSALIINREGCLVDSYDKVHCQAHDRKYRIGRRLPVFASDFGPFGVLICADRRWPETVRALAVQGARIIFNPTYGLHNDLNRSLMRTRAYESEVFLAFTHPAQALVTGPSGSVVTDEVRTQVRFALSSIDLSEVDRARADETAHLRDRRLDLYGG